MSSWTSINGTIIVTPMGRTQAEKTYILNTVLDHLPKVTGSEGDMNIHFFPKNGTNSSMSCDEFGEETNNLTDINGNKTYKRGWLRTQDDYIIIVNGDLRDRVFKVTYKEFLNWLVRLSKRIMVKDILVEVYENGKSSIIQNNSGQFFDMYESPSWVNHSKYEKGNWCEYLMWENFNKYDFPKKLAKYYNLSEET